MNRIKNELYPLLTGNFEEGETELDLLSRRAFAKILRTRAKKLIQENGYPPLSKEEIRQIKQYYKGYPAVSTIYHRVNKGKSGKFYPEWMPEELYYGYIEPYFSKHLESRYVDHKCDYYKMFEGIKQPELVCMRTRGLWRGQDFQPMTKKEVLTCLRQTKGEVVVKRAENSEGGAGVHFLSSERKEEEFKALMRTIPGDVVIQKSLQQHPAYAAFHPSSVNTLRILSLLEPDGVHILSACIRIGVGGSRQDNSACGGIFVGIQKNGRLRDLGILGNGETVKKHPDLGYVLKNQELPHLERAYALVKKAHPYVGRFRLVTWDIAMDAMGEANLIEVNLTLGMIDDMQACNGPIFGNNTRRILREVFGR